MSYDLLVQTLRTWQPPEPFFRQDHFVHVQERGNYITFTIDFKTRHRYQRFMKGDRCFVRYKDHKDHLINMLETRPFDLLDQVRNGLTLRAKALLNPAINTSEYYRGLKNA